MGYPVLTVEGKQVSVHTHHGDHEESLHWSEVIHNFQGCNSITHYICKFVYNYVGLPFECTLYIYYVCTLCMHCTVCIYIVLCTLCMYSVPCAFTYIHYFVYHNLGY